MLRRGATPPLPCMRLLPVVDRTGPVPDRRSLIECAGAVPVAFTGARAPDPSRPIDNGSGNRASRNERPAQQHNPSQETTMQTMEKNTPPTKLAHFVLRTSRYPEVVDYYMVLLCAQPSFANEALTFLTYDEEHHRIAVINVPAL